MQFHQSSRRAYDHRIREHICRTRNPALFPELRIPRSTTTSWLRRPLPVVVSCQAQPEDVVALHERMPRLEARVRTLAAVVRIQRTLLHVSGFSLEHNRLPDGAAKESVLRAVARAKKALPLAGILRILHLSRQRYHRWMRGEPECGLDDRSSCPRTSPAQHTPQEISTIREMVTSNDYRHMPMTTLARYAQRIGRVFASASTWSKLARERGWRRPRMRLYPAKPKIGVRATGPNEYWHIDVTVIRLITGVKLYLHAVIDNFSRRILAWRLAERLDPTTTCEVLLEAGKEIGCVPTVVADSGMENVNEQVNELVKAGVSNRILALVEVAFSNSIIEAWWRSLRYQWLYLHMLDSFNSVKRLIAFWVDQHNTVMPHSAFLGQTPDEIYFGTGDHVPAELRAAHRAAQQRRLTENRAARCRLCNPGHLAPIESESKAAKMEFQ
jgi:putative transposase